MSAPTPPIKGRFAPSPSGRMHLGNIATALISWLAAHKAGGTWLLRIEDLDPQRSKYEYARLIEDDLHWLGLDWDEGGLDDIGTAGPYTQSRRSDIYADILSRLDALGLTYNCTCTRADIMATQAPHLSDGRIIYNGRCRPQSRPPFPPRDTQAKAAVRLWVPDSDITYDDLIAGPQHYNLAQHCGDFVLRRSDGAWAYQLAVVADDAQMGVTQVVRGDDLLASAAQQIYLYQLLGLEPPQYGHLPLVRNAEGRRLSKRDADMSMQALRQHHTPAEVLGLAAAATGLRPTPDATTTHDLLSDFDITKVVKSPE